jgi:3-hydroxypropanoate dehydrogenase
MARILDDRTLDSLFRAARPCRAWLERGVSDAIIEALWELARLPPTATGASPVRVLFLKSSGAKEQLAPALAEADAAAVRTAPVAALFAYEAGGVASLRDASLQAGYLILAARALGLDCAPLALADPVGADRAFFPGGEITSSFACAFGYGDPGTLGQSVPGPGFEQACRIL